MITPIDYNTTILKFCCCGNGLSSDELHERVGKINSSYEDVICPTRSTFSGINELVGEMMLLPRGWNLSNEIEGQRSAGKSH